VVVRNRQYNQYIALSQLSDLRKKNKENRKRNETKRRRKGVKRKGRRKKETKRDGESDSGCTYGPRDKLSNENLQKD
jgi:hypothetical protein